MKLSKANHGEFNKSQGCKPIGLRTDKKVFNCTERGGWKLVWALRPKLETLRK